MTKSILKDRETVGTLAKELLEKPIENISVADQGAEMIKPYIDELFTALKRAKKDWPNQDFFITVLQQRNRLIPNLLRNYFIPRHTCPTPDYDQTVYRYSFRDDELMYVWTIPDRQSCHDLIENALTIADEYRELLQYVLDFRDGTLFKRARELNNEDGLKTGITLQVLNDRQSEESEKSCGRTY